jgi:nitrile hydratase
MNGIHDLGGMDGFGKVDAPLAEPPFHDAWEGRVLAMNRIMGATGEWNIDVGRYWIETLPPWSTSSSYYKKWMLRLERLCLARGLVTEAELEAGHASGPGRPLKKKSAAAAAQTGFVRQSCQPPATAAARFQVGDRVRRRTPPVRTRACARWHAVAWAQSNVSRAAMSSPTPPSPRAWNGPNGSTP